MNETIALIVGYLASLLLAISLLVSNDLKFRWLNTFGCLSFIVYGLLINAFPIIVTNSILLLINTFYLLKIYRQREDFDVLEFAYADPLIHKFFAFYKNDLAKYFPGFKPAENEKQIRFIVLRDMAIANIFIAEVMDDGTAVIKLNYTVPKYRDYKVGKFLFQKEQQLLITKGISRLVYTHISNKQHESYLLKMGFRSAGIEGQSYYYKPLT